MYCAGLPCLPGRKTNNLPRAVTEGQGLIVMWGASLPSGAVVIVLSVVVALTWRSTETGGWTTPDVGGGAV